MNFQVLKGTHDVILDEAFSYSSIENLLKAIAQGYAFEEFRIPVIEKSELFTRSVGESSDIVRKEMYTFLDKGDRSITLRPEFTAGIVRSMVNAKLFANQDYPIKAYYCGPVFRYERPQQGRYRQFNQFGIELVGSDSYLRDVEAITFGYHCLEMLGFKNVTMKINSLGDEESRNNYRKALIEYFSQYIGDMCGDCKERLNINPLRILDCKVENDRKIIENAPKIEDFLSENSKIRFANICNSLDLLGVKYEIDTSLVRGLDYYSETVFEYHFVSSKGNNYGAIGAGGHYSKLVSEIGGPALPGVGLSFGIERLYSILKDDNKLPEKDRLNVYIMPITKDPTELNEIFALADFLRLNGFTTEINVEGNSMGSMFKKAEKRRAKFAVIVGENEVISNTVNIKNMDTKEQVTIALADIVRFLDMNLSEEAHTHEEHECCCGHHHEEGHECSCEHDDCQCEDHDHHDHECCCGHRHEK